MRITLGILLLFFFACTPVEPTPKPSVLSASAPMCRVGVMSPTRFSSLRPTDRPRGARARLNPNFYDGSLLRETDEVRYFLSMYTTSKGRSFVSDALPRRNLYLPLIERVFYDYGIPSELSNLAFVESGFRPMAKSGKGATGLWQFMKETARRYDLQVSFWQDERKDVFKSTVAAARYLVELHRKFGDWYLALGAYNNGPAAIDRAVAEGQTRDFFELTKRGLVNKETSAFVAKVIALSMITRDLTVYGFNDIPRDIAG